MGHDVGKHILDDAILKGDTKLDDEQWEFVKRHPEEGARIVRLLEGQEAVAEIIHAHHERIDGRGYPRRLAGEEIPRLSRMISIADTYDVMTARDSYRDPVSSAEAIAELRRVSGAQLDASSSRSSSARCSATGRGVRPRRRRGLRGGARRRAARTPRRAAPEPQLSAA